MVRILSLLLVLAASTTCLSQTRPYCGKVVCDLPESVLRVDGEKYPFSNVGSFVIVAHDYVLTNQHVVADHLMEKGLGHETYLYLFFSEGISFGEVVAYDKSYDLALIHTETPEGTFPIPIAESYDTDVVTVAGFAGGEDYNEIVSANIKLDSRFEYGFKFEGVFEKGMSGSPVINSRGSLCGLLFASDYNPDLRPPHYGFATRVEFVREFLSENDLTP